MTCNNDFSTHSTTHHRKSLLFFTQLRLHFLLFCVFILVTKSLPCFVRWRVLVGSGHNNRKFCIKTRKSHFPLTFLLVFVETGPSVSRFFFHVPFLHILTSSQFSLTGEDLSKAETRKIKTKMESRENQINYQQ